MLPRYATHKWEDDHSYRGSPQGAKIPIPIADSPSLASFIREESLEFLSLKASWICIQRAGGPIGNKDSTRKGHTQNLNPSSPSEEAVILKDSGSGTLILESPRKARGNRDSPWRYRHWRQSFLGSSFYRSTLMLASDILESSL